MNKKNFTQNEFLFHRFVGIPNTIKNSTAALINRCKLVLFNKAYRHAIWLLALLGLWLIWRTARVLIISIVTMDSIKLDTTTMLDPEPMKILSSHWGGYHLIDYANNNLDENQAILTFRPSDFAFYGRGNYFDYQTPTIHELLKEKDPRSLLSKLKRLGVTHIYIPDYPLPEIYNTGIAEIISSPEMSKLSKSYGNYRLFELGPFLVKPTIHTLIGEDFSLTPDAKNNWSFYSSIKPPLSMAQGITAKKVFKKRKSDTFLEVSAKIGIISDKKQIGFHNSKIIMDFPPFFDDKNDATKLIGKEIEFSSLVEGHGQLNVDLIIYSRNAGDLKEVRKNVWTGILTGEKKFIRSQIFVNTKDFDLYKTTNHEAEYSYRLVYRLSDGAGGWNLKMYNWKINEIKREKFGDSHTDYLAQRSFYRHGWRVVNSKLPISFENFGGKFVDDHSTVRYQAKNSAHGTLFSPVFLLPNTPIQTLSNKPEKTKMSIPPSLHVSFRAKGEGVLLPNLNINCDGSLTTIPLYAKIMNGNEMDISYFSTIPCYPSLVYLGFNADYNRYLSSPSKRPGRFQISDIKLSLTKINSENLPINIELIPSSFPYSATTEPVGVPVRIINKITSLGN